MQINYKCWSSSQIQLWNQDFLDTYDIPKYLNGSSFASIEYLLSLGIATMHGDIIAAMQVLMDCATLCYQLTVWSKILIKSLEQLFLETNFHWVKSERDAIAEEIRTGISFTPMTLKSIPIMYEYVACTQVTTWCLHYIYMTIL